MFMHRVFFALVFAFVLAFATLLVPIVNLARQAPSVATHIKKLGAENSQMAQRSGSWIVVAQNAQPQTGERVELSRVILGSGLPAAMPGWELSMRRVTTPPGAGVPGEIHPGMQVIYIVSGILNLKVLGGEVQVRRVKPDGSQGEVETIESSATEVVLKAGDTILEPEVAIVAPRNAGNEPLIALTASLLPVGKPQSIPIAQSIVIPK